MKKEIAPPDLFCTENIFAIASHREEISCLAMQFLTLQIGTFVFLKAFIFVHKNMLLLNTEETCFYN